VTHYLLCFRLQLTCHLLPAGCCCRLYLLQFAGKAITPTYSSRLCLFRVLSGICPSPFLQCGALPACYSCSPCLFRVCMGNFPSLTLRWSMPHISHCYKPCPPQAHWQESTNPPSPVGLFIYSLHRCLPLLLQSSRRPAHFAMCLFQFFVYSVFWFFLFCGAEVSVSRGLCWFIPGVGVGIPLAAYLLTCWSAFPKQVRSQHLLEWEPSWFLHITWHGEAMCRLEVRGCWIFASS
jgi:hypothetical protein